MSVSLSVSLTDVRYHDRHLYLDLYINLSPSFMTHKNLSGHISFAPCFFSWSSSGEFVILQLLLWQIWECVGASPQHLHHENQAAIKQPPRRAAWAEMALSSTGTQQATSDTKCFNSDSCYHKINSLSLSPGISCAPAPHPSHLRPLQWSSWGPVETLPHNPLFYTTSLEPFFQIVLQAGTGLQRLCVVLHL